MSVTFDRCALGCAALGLLVATGCQPKPEAAAAPTVIAVEPAPQAMRTVEAPSPVTSMAMPELPKGSVDTLELTFPASDPSVRPESVAKLTDLALPTGASIVIDLPTDQPIGMTKSAVQSSYLRYRSVGYAHHVESELERALIRRGLKVIDRTRFEAKLRDLRDRAEYLRNHWWSRNVSSQTNPALDGLLEKLGKDLAENKITQQQYQEKAAEAMNQMRVASSTTKRGENEVADRAELMRAVIPGNGEPKAEYLLHVDRFELSPRGRRAIDLANNPAIKTYMAKHPGLRVGANPETSLPANVYQPAYVISASAKIIQVESGAIIWTAEHELDVSALFESGTSVTFQTSREVSNVDDILDPVRAYNTRVKAAYDKAATAHRSLVRVMDRHDSVRTFTSQYEADQYVASRQTELNRAMNAFNTSLGQLATAEASRPTEEVPLLYAYKIQGPFIQPDLRGMDSKESSAVSPLLVKLKRLFIQEIIDSIPVSEP
jgi:hypothetical protein